ncbi:MAG: hypothetical protein RL701_3050 [Pseudomonadota bacterium]|jgi:hypothetical protein
MRRGFLPEPVSAADGTRYEVFNGNFERFDLQRGAIAAVDPATDEELWALLVYEIPVNPKWERDVQDVFITQLRLEEADTKLVVVNARQKTFVVDLATRTVTERT